MKGRQASDILQYFFSTIYDGVYQISDMESYQIVTMLDLCDYVLQA